MDRRLLVAVGALALLALGILAGCAGPIGPTGSAGPAGVQGPAAPAKPEAGLQMTITKAEIPADRKPVVTFNLTDGAGVALKIEDLDDLGKAFGIPGFMPARFTAAYLKEDAQANQTQWVNLVMAPGQGEAYTFNGQQEQPAIAQGTQPSILMDMGGSYKDLGQGNFTYTFATALPEDYDKNATYRVGGEASRGGEERSVNNTFDFVPSGGAIKTRQVVATASCNQCHDPLALHGGLRTDTKLCVVCHTSQNVDLETGNTVEFKNVVHKIHRGASLPSVVGGEPYILKGFPPEPVDFSTVVWPQFGGSTIGDLRTCTTCHGAPPVGMSAEDYAKAAPDANNYKNKPSRAACGACHDNIDWATGKSTITGKRDHPGGPQANDNACAVCHVADSGNEFDASVVGAHTIPAESKQLKGMNVDIVRVTNTAPGQNPTVVFTAKDNSGKALLLSEITSLSFNVNGPTTDYQGLPVTEAATLSKAVIDADGSFTYTLTKSISNNATGTYAIGIEARRLETIVGNEGVSANVSGASYNPVVYIPVTDKVAVPRRQIVATENCNVCHGKIAFHGGGRLNTTAYCETCHNPANVDVPEKVPATLGGPFNVPPESINFKLMIHRIHSGEDLTRDFTIYRTRGVFNFNEVRFPGDRTNCAKCHVNNSNLLPLPETNANTLAPREFYSPLGPAAAACLGCHDSKKAASHASSMTTVIGEACAVCHGQGRDFAVEKVHAR